MSPSYLAVLVRCLGVLFLAQLGPTMDTCHAFQFPRCISWVGRRHARWCENDRALVSWRKLWFRSCIPLTSGRFPVVRRRGAEVVSLGPDWFG